MREIYSCKNLFIVWQNWIYLNTTSWLWINFALQEVEGNISRYFFFFFFFFVGVFSTVNPHYLEYVKGNLNTVHVKDWRMNHSEDGAANIWENKFGYQFNWNVFHPFCFLALKDFSFERTWWRLFQKRVERIKFDITVYNNVHVYICFHFYHWVDWLTISPRMHHPFSSQSFSTDMVYYIYLFLSKFTVPK